MEMRADPIARATRRTTENRMSRKSSDDVRRCARNFRAPRIGHDTKAAELVATFLDRDEAGDLAAIQTAIGPSQIAKFLVCLEVDEKGTFAASRLFEGFGQPMVGLRTKNKID